MEKELTVVIPTRSRLDRTNVSLASLETQDYRKFKVVVQEDEGKGAQWARNRGFELCDTEFVLFCDDDIDWNPKALGKMIRFLKAHPDASYCYCAYQLADTRWCLTDFDSARIKKVNYISTMSVIRSADFPGFDPEIKRLQDWDVWLTMLERGHVGVWCGELLFSTFKRSGITFGNPMGYTEAAAAVKLKHGL